VNLSKGRHISLTQKWRVKIGENILDGEVAG
jgi:hypothetical protein